MKATALWGVVLGAATLGVAGAVIDARKTASKIKPETILPIVDSARSGGFTVRGEIVPELDLRSGNTRLKASIWATGKTFSNEVLLLEGGYTLVKPNGRSGSFGPNGWTFGERLEASMLVSKIDRGSVVNVSGQIRVFRREQIKVEREIMPDGSVKLYMNTGTVHFKRIPNSNPPKMEVICENLGEVHQHGLELLNLDKKTVSGRIMLFPGRQEIIRENYPYLSKATAMLPIFVWQLIPKRNEPINMTLAVPARPVPKS